MAVVYQPPQRRRCGLCLFELPPNVVPIENTSARGADSLTGIETEPPSDVDLFSDDYKLSRRPAFTLTTLEVSGGRGCRCCMMLRGALVRFNHDLSRGMTLTDQMYWASEFGDRLDWIGEGKGGAFELFSPASIPSLRSTCHIIAIMLWNS
jgi:hypothetical protein